MSEQSPQYPTRIERLTPEFIRYRVMHLWRESKHLQLVDCFALTTEALLHGHFYYQLRPGPLHPDDLYFWDQIAFWNMVTAIPDLAQSSGYLPWLNYSAQLSVHDTLWFAQRNDEQWDREVYTPAFEAAMASNWRVNLDTRFGEVIFHWAEIQQASVLSRTAQSDRTAIARAVQKNVGDNKQHDSELSGPECAAWLQFASDQVPKDLAFKIAEDGSLDFREGALDSGLLAHFDDAVRFPTRLKSLDVASDYARKESIGAQTEDRTIVGPELELLARELRDQLDTFDRYPFLSEEASVAVRNPRWYGFAKVQALLELRDALDKIDDRALQAAVVYERARPAPGHHGGVSRKQVAEAYAVTSRQIETREAMARGVLRRLAA